MFLIKTDIFLEDAAANDYFRKFELHRKWSFPLRISSVNVIKSAVSCGFGHI